mgnify:FL=1
MDEKFYRTVIQMLDDTITVYQELLDLYKEKKQALLTPKNNEILRVVDEKILAHINTVKNVNEKREEFCKENDIDPAKISTLIEFASKDNKEFEEILSEQKVKINEVAQEIALIEKTNVELIKHGLIMSDKLLDIIISAAMPQTDNYDMHGKNIDTSELSISSIVEDA